MACLHTYLQILNSESSIHFLKLKSYIWNNVCKQYEKMVTMKILYYGWIFLKTSFKPLYRLLISTLNTA